MFIFFKKKEHSKKFFKLLRDLLLKKQAIFMTKNLKQIICYHPEKEHSFELTRV